MMHDTADTESESEAVQEAATVAEGAGFGAENDVASRYTTLLFVKASLDTAAARQQDVFAESIAVTIPLLPLTV